MQMKKTQIIIIMNKRNRKIEIHSNKNQLYNNKSSNKILS